MTTALRDGPLFPLSSWTRRPAGLAVLRLGWPHEAIAALVDWLVPGAYAPAWRSLLDACGEAARGAGLSVIRVWLPPTSPDRDALLQLGFVSEVTPFLVSLWNDHCAERPLPTVRSSWHYTMGDTDIF